MATTRKRTKDAESKEEKAGKAAKVDSGKPALNDASLAGSGELQVCASAQPIGSHLSAADPPTPATPTLPADEESALPFLKKMIPWLSSRLLQWIPAHMPELLAGSERLSSLTDLEPLKISSKDKGFKETYNLPNMASGLTSMNLYEASFTLWMADLRPTEEDNELWSVYSDFLNKARLRS